MMAHKDAQDRGSVHIPGAAQLLAALGIVPLMLLGGLVWFAADADTGQMFMRSMLIYGALVLSFLGGVRWGGLMVESPPAPLITSLVIGLLPLFLGWVCVLMKPSSGLALMIGAFLGQALLSYLSGQSGSLKLWQARLNIAVCLIAIISLSAGFFRLLWPLFQT